MKKRMNKKVRVEYEIRKEASEEGKEDSME